MNTSSSHQGWSVWRAVAAFLFGVAVITGCVTCAGVGTGGTGSFTSSTVAQSALARDTSPQVADADLVAVVAGNTEFALKAFPLIDPGGGANTVFSPYSITQALALTAAGARGTTLSGIERALAFPLPQDRLNPAFNKLDLLLKTRTSGAINDTVGQAPQLNIVNAVWAQQDFPLLPAFLDTIAVNFGAGLRLADFVHAPEASRQTINGWVEDQTNKRITDLLPQGVIDSATRLVLTNAIWFKANWAAQFAENDTQNKPFFSRNGSSSPVPFMRQVFSLPYAQTGGCRAVDIPYVEGNLSMLVIMPDAGTFGAFLAALTPATLSDVTKALSNRDIDLALPKFTFSANAPVKPVLSAVGMADAFDPSKADFSAIDGKRDLSISDVFHKAFIGVDEKGTEAAAATAVVITTTASVGGSLPPPLPLVVDHPFIFLIRDRQTGLILFLGKVANL